MTTRTTSALEALRERIATEIAERLREHVDRIGWDAGRIAEHQRGRLRELLVHAIERSPFHARRLAAIDPQGFELSDLSQLAVMTKAEMMANFDELVTDRRVRLADVERHLADAPSAGPSLLLDEYVCLASGGSSGLRGIFVQTVGEYADFAASIMRRGMARAIVAGGPPPEGLVISLVAAASPIHSTGFAAGVARSAPVHFHAAPATLPLAEIVRRLNATQPPALIGYPSALARLARELEAGRLRIAPRALTCTSEMLAPEDRAAISTAFGVPVIDQFASTEGLVGHSEPGGTGLSFASDMCIVELVDEQNRPVGEGEQAAKALVTNLHNFTQPLIRYELTDRFVRLADALEHGHLRATVEGRADEVFEYGGAEVHPHVVRSIMVAVPAVREYEVRQTEQGLELAVVCESDLDRTALAEALEQGLCDAGLANPHVEVHAVDAIARHVDSGKVRRFIPLERRS